MRHAILILAHKNSEQIGRLVARLKHKNLDIFIHLDKKWKITEQEKNDILKKNSNVYICDKRISCSLDKWSLVAATYELLKFAKNNGNYGYFCLLSGQDYPIKSLNFIINRLNELYPKPLIDCTPYDKSNWISSGFKRIRFVDMHNMVHNVTKNRFLRNIMMLPIYIIEFIATFILGSPIKRLNKIHCKLYGGSAWWILPKPVVEEVIQQIDMNTELVKAFKLKTTPEETFFQTITMKTELSNLVDINPIDAVAQNCETFAYFQDVDKEPTGHPYIFTINEFKKIQNLPHLFARKFDINIDSAILDKIDSEILFM